MFCSHCGKELLDGMMFCGYCGKRVWTDATVRKMLDRQNALPTASPKLSTPQAVAAIPAGQTPQEPWQPAFQPPARPQPDAPAAASPLQQDSTAKISRTIVAVMTTVMSLFLLSMHFAPLFEVSFFEKKGMSALSLISKTKQLMDRFAAVGADVSGEKALLIFSMIAIIGFMLVIAVSSALVLVWLATDRPYTIRLFVPVIISMLLSFAVQWAMGFYIDNLQLMMNDEITVVEITSAGYAYAAGSILFPILLGISSPKACVKKRSAVRRAEVRYYE